MLWGHPGEAWPFLSYYGGWVDWVGGDKLGGGGGSQKTEGRGGYSQDVKLKKNTKATKKMT